MRFALACRTEPLASIISLKQSPVIMFTSTKRRATIALLFVVPEVVAFLPSVATCCRDGLRPIDAITQFGPDARGVAPIRGPDTSTGIERLRGYREALVSHGSFRPPTPSESSLGQELIHREETWCEYHRWPNRSSSEARRYT